MTTYRLIPENGFSREEQIRIRERNNFSTRSIAHYYVLQRLIPSAYYTEIDQYGRMIISGINTKGYSSSIAIVVND